MPDWFCYRCYSRLLTFSYADPEIAALGKSDQDFWSICLFQTQRHDYAQGKFSYSIIFIYGLLPNKFCMPLLILISLVMVGRPGCVCIWWYIMQLLKHNYVLNIARFLSTPMNEINPRKLYYLLSRTIILYYVVLFWDISKQEKDFLTCRPVSLSPVIW